MLNSVSSRILAFFLSALTFPLTFFRRTKVTRPFDELFPTPRAIWKSAGSSEVGQMWRLAVIILIAAGFVIHSTSLTHSGREE